MFAEDGMSYHRRPGAARRPPAILDWERKPWRAAEGQNPSKTTELRIAAAGDMAIQAGEGRSSPISARTARITPSGASACHGLEKVKRRMESRARHRRRHDAITGVGHIIWTSFKGVTRYGHVCTTRVGSDSSARCGRGFCVGPGCDTAGAASKPAGLHRRHGSEQRWTGSRRLGDRGNKDLPTNFIKIVVTDDAGKFALPELPAATYSRLRARVRPRRLDAVQLKPGAPGSNDVQLTATLAKTALEAAKVYQATTGCRCSSRRRRASSPAPGRRATASARRCARRTITSTP